MAVTRIGVVGAGDIGRIHARSLAKIPEVRVVVARGKDPARAEELAREVAGETAESYASLLEDASVAGVSICVPNDMHAEYAVSALETGKAVLCEKPLALTLEDALEMERVAERTGRLLVAGHVVRFWPEYAEARRLMQSGALGPVQSYSARRLVPLLRAVTGAEGWRHSAERSGGAVIDLQIHDVDFVLWAFGRPAAVTSRGVRSHTGAFDHVFTLLEYEDGPVVELEASFMLQGNPVTMDFRALGPEGSVEFAFVESDFAMHDIHTDGGGEVRDAPASLVLYRWGQPRDVRAVQEEDPVGAIFDAELRAFVDAVRGEAQPELPSTREAIDALRVVLASRRSCETGETVRLEYDHGS